MRVSGGVAAGCSTSREARSCPRLAARRGPGRVPRRAGRPGRDRGSAARARRPAGPAGPRQLEVAVERMRFALGVDDDLGEFYRRFRRDPLLGPLLRRGPDFRPRRRPWPWEALAWAVVKQLIESERATRIQRRIVGRWGARLGGDREGLRDVPGAELIAGRAPAELESMGLLAAGDRLRAVAREVAAGRCDLGEAPADRRLLAVPEIGPWTVQCLGLFGRGDPDSLPGRRPRLRQAGRPPRAARPPRHGRGGRGVLRAVRALPGPGRRPHPRRPAPRGRAGPAAPLAADCMPWTSVVKGPSICR